jgi:hypothetical protein
VRAGGSRLNEDPTTEVLMILKFPNLETLRLALTTGVIPPAVSQTPIVAGFDDEQLWVDTSAAFSRTAQNDLKKLGVQTAKTSGVNSTINACCWAELLPLQADAKLIDRLEQTPVLFDLAGGEDLAQLVVEILRLGNDRQSFRWLEGGNEDKEGDRALLRVVGPPYYSLLRAIDRNGNKTGPTAYVERAPRVWVELGHSHPLAEHVKPPEGKLLLLRPPRQWTLLNDGTFRDIYEVLEFPLADAPVRWQEGKLGMKMRVAPTLKPGGPPEGAELWVLRDNPVEELNRFVQNADDQMLNRLAFAVGEKGDRKTIVLRVRQSKLPPPVIVLKAEGYRPYLKLPNLFLPVGTRLHPPLRRDVVRKLLAEDINQLTWLTPSLDGSFTPEGMPENAFRPLWDWIDYVLDHDKEALQAWVQASQFDFEPFVCDEDAPKPKKPPEKPEKPPREKPARKDGRDFSESRFQNTADEDEPEEETSNGVEEFAEVLPVAEPNVLQEQLTELEHRFAALEGGLDTEERQALWPELANLNAALGNAEEAGICYANAFWGQETVSPGTAWNWFLAEASDVPGRAATIKRVGTWVTRVTTAGIKDREVSGEDLDRLLAEQEPTAADVRSLAAYIVWSARRKEPPAALVERLNPVQRFLEDNEKYLPVRIVWLAWSHLVQLSRGDVLALARTRDRLLERLFQNGLQPQLDLPTFLRSAGQPANLRFHAVREWMVNLCEQARNWVTESKEKSKDAITPTELTCGYIDLIFAFGLARLSEHDACRQLMHRAKAALAEAGEVALFLYQAFEYRVKQALDGKPHAGPLPNEQLEFLELIGAKEQGQEGRIHRYAVDRLREHSRILEPHQEINPYRHWFARTSDLDKALSELTDLTDKQEIIDRVTKLLREQQKGAKGNEARALILREALNQAPRVSEEFARDMLDRVTSAYDALPEAEDDEGLVRKAGFLEKALFVAAHFDRVEHIYPLIARFQKMLEEQQGPQATKALDSIAGKCFRGLRKVGMREEIGQLLKLMARVILGGKELKSLDMKKGGTGREAVRPLLHVASGWYYFGSVTQADPVVETARTLLFKADLPYKDQTLLACTYAATLGQAPVESAQKRLEELFQNLKGVRDTYTTNRYYSLYQLKVVEAVVLAVVSDDFTLGANARRWLDDDEFLVRRRIHKDLRAMMGN